MQDGLAAGDGQLVVADKGAEPLARTLGFLFLKHRAAGKIALAFKMHAKSQPGLDRRVIGGDIGAPVEIALFEAQRFNRAISDIADAMRLPLLPEAVINMAREFGGDMQLPTEFADIADPHGLHMGGADDDLLRGREWEGSVGNIVLADRLQHLARFRPANVDHRPRRRDIVQIDRAVLRQCAADPVTVMHTKARAGDDIEPVRAGAGDGQIGFDTAMFIAKLRVDHAADGLVHVGHRDALQYLQRAGADHLEFREAGLVDQGDALAHSLVFQGGILLPAGVDEGKLIDGLDTFRRKPERAFPAILGPIDRAMFLQPVMKRAEAQVTGAFGLLPRIAYLVVMRVMLDSARIHEGARRVMRAEAAHV